MRVAIIMAAALVAGCAGPGSRQTDSGPTLAERVDALESHVQRLDNRMESGQMLDLIQTVERLQADLRDLRGDVERLGNDSESLNRRQRELYLDLDRRLQGIEAGGRPAGDAAGAAAIVPGPVDAPAAGDEVTQRVAYDQAFKMLQEGRYPQAIGAFQQYLQTYPDGRYVDNAQYWLGEAYYVTRDYSTALGEFNRVVAEFPDSQKVPDAMLKIGYVHYELKQWDEARNTLTAVAQRVPGTTIARLAEQRLQRMRQEGR